MRILPLGCRAMAARTMVLAPSAMVRFGVKVLSSEPLAENRAMALRAGGLPDPSINLGK